MQRQLEPPTSPDSVVPQGAADGRGGGGPGCWTACLVPVVPAARRSFKFLVVPDRDPGPRIRFALGTGLSPRTPAGRPRAARVGTFLRPAALTLGGRPSPWA